MPHSGWLLRPENDFEEFVPRLDDNDVTLEVLRECLALPRTGQADRPIHGKDGRRQVRREHFRICARRHDPRIRQR